MNDPAFVQELTACQRRLSAYIRTLVPSPAEADDLLQETNMALMKKSADFQAGTRFLTWACRVAYYEVLNFYRTRRRAPLALGDETILQCVAAEAGEQLERFDDRLTALRSCLQSLDAPKRRLLRRYYFDELSLAEIAGERGQSEGVVRVTVHRIRGALLACIERTLAMAGRA